MDKTRRLAAVRRELRALRARYPRSWQPISGCPGTLAYTYWRDTRGRIQTPQALIRASLRDKGYNPYACNLGWIQ